MQSNLLPVISGVPQGSILGPLLFLIYINDLPNSINASSIYLFADDTKFIHCVANFCNSFLQSDIDSMSEWCLQWRLNLNLSKCTSMRFALSPSTYADPQYSISGQVIGHTHSQRDLGIIVSSNLSWTLHYNSICSNAYRSLNFIRRVISHQSSTVQFRKQLYLSLVRSKLTYCSQLWRPYLIKDIKLLENVQRRSTKYILHDYSSNYKQRLISLNLLPLMHWFELQDLLFLIKNLQNPSDNFQMLNFISFVSSSTRAASANKLRYNYSAWRLSTTRHFYFNRIVRLWNALPPLNLSLPFLSIKHQLIEYFWYNFVNKFDPDNPCSFHVICPCSKCHLLRF